MPEKLLKHRQVYEHLKRSILEGEYAAGDRVPTETELQEQFKTSRITISRAVRDLAREGYLVRRRGAGSFVKASTPVSQLFAMLVPDELGGIFVPMCSTIAQELNARGSQLMISNLDRGEPAAILQRAEEACRRYAANGVRGLFLAPFELPSDQMWLNQRIAEMMISRGMSVVLLDRDVCWYPARSEFDLVGSESHHCAYRLTRHLLNLGRRRILFVAGTAAASTTLARIAGYRSAMEAAGLPHADGVRCFTQETLEGLAESSHLSDADACVCNNDHLAVHVIRGLLGRGIRVPEDVAVVGIDDVDYAALVPVPLTTMRQPLDQIARAAVRLLLERIAEPTLPARKLSFACELVIRKTCGTGIRRAAPHHSAEPAKF